MKHLTLHTLMRPFAVLSTAAAMLLAMSGCSGPAQTGAGRADSGYLYGTAELRDITASISDSGTLQPADSYTVFCLVSGEILQADFETGDTVAKDDVLYRIDSENIANSIERAENALAQRQRTLEDALADQEALTVRAPIGGTLSGFSTLAGSRVSAGSPLAVVEDTNTLLLTEYYSEDYSGRIVPGMEATISIPEQMLTLPGRVHQVHSLRRVSPTGVSCFAVTVEVTNPGSLTVGTTATCWLNSHIGAIYPTISDENGLEANDRKLIIADVSGTVEQVHVRDGEIVRADDILLEMSSETVEDQIINAQDSVRDAQLSLDSQYDALENYTIQAPIDGTIVDKYYKQGENAETGKTLCTIFDLSCLTVTLNIDELDIKRIHVGQNAAITCDSVPGSQWQGTITEVSINGTTGSGVTTYPVKIQIDEADGLLPGMNVDVDIITEQNEGVLTVPASAVITGSRVLCKTADGSTGSGAPEGYDYVKVELGSADEDHVEILSGLKAGDQIAWLPAGPMNSSLEMMMGMGMNAHMGGPMGGGQMGSRPSGGMGQSR